MEIAGENILFLLGAGASHEAEIPISFQMVDQIEMLVIDDPKWSQFKELYYYLKSSIQYADGIFGNFNDPFNVEKLLIVITEIEKRDKNIMYPFIGTWNMRLMDLAGDNFTNLTAFKELIINKLNEWVRLKDYGKANYYEGFASLKNEIGNLLRVFTLNYDLCFERVVGKSQSIELGFDSSTKEWHYANFDSHDSKDFFLYKLHGSINWYTTDEQISKLKISDDPVESPELIFGIQHKMTSIDPYFFFSSEFRKLCLEAETKLIICLGYSFSDDYINNIISQAVIEKDEAKILIVAGPNDDGDKLVKSVSKKLKITKESILVEPIGAKKFLLEKMNKDYLTQHIHDSKDAPFQ
ncbi:SIR2 family protein [Muricauda sp. SCSIO 64092]|uniref:SIR2 family protein n=1 Tax=Allomuricauda sp. SCSIO 64092 TaxID=2908842 RepID=UPI001FF13E8F|nr:SIR2 family protein [Muricauda sp. SCSIO 64092]UOY08922.1 SIR2 family protein [Muricauda sp. SCSIO 64092]